MLLLTLPLGIILSFLPLPRAYLVRTTTVRAPACWLFRCW